MIAAMRSGPVRRVGTTTIVRHSSGMPCSKSIRGRARGLRMIEANQFTTAMAHCDAARAAQKARTGHARSGAPRDCMTSHTTPAAESSATGPR